MLIGHSSLYNHIETAIGNNQHHGFLLSGLQGIGKATLAKKLAISTLSKASPFSAKIVEQQCATGAYPNYFYLCQLIDDDGKPKKEITVEQIRTLLNSLKQKAALPGLRIVVIDSIDNLNRQAANALLKVLEEPPQETIFLNICHNLGNVLPTIRSRCLLVNFKPLPEVDLVNVITQHGHQLEPAIVSMASGSPGAYEKILEAGGAAVISALQNLLSITNLNTLKSAIQELLKQTDDTFLMQLLHQLLYRRSLKEPETYAPSVQAVERFLRYTHNTHIDGVHRLQAAVLLAQNPEHEEVIYG